MRIGDWTVFAHPLLLDQLERMTKAVENAKVDDPSGYKHTPQTKVLAMLGKLIFEIVPGDPARPEYRQGDTLGPERKHWFLAKFGNGRFRLFFRFDSRSRIVIFAWVNDENSLRTYGSKTDAYRVFKGMLQKGNPPDDWTSLLAAASARSATGRLAKSKPK